jgi:WD40 repeat protein
VAQVFISYATSDRRIANEVSSWLRAAGHEPFVDHDIRSGIAVGEAWRERLYRELREVDAVIGVVTSSSVASTWCSAELGIADALGCRLLPLRAEAGVVHPLLEGLQQADYEADPQEARDRILQTLRLLEYGDRTWKEGDNPFPGLEPFTAALSRVFFGRGTEVRDVGNRLRSMSGLGGLLAIVGPSGCGKSSLLRAAVVPLLEGDPTWLTVPPVVPGTDPFTELARVLAVVSQQLGLNWLASDVRGRLEADSDGLQRVANDLLAASAAAHRRLLVPIDQAEELFTRTTPAVMRQLAQSLRAAVGRSVQVVASLRSEFLDDLRDLPDLAHVPIEAYVLAPLDREMLRDVIEQPARVARLRLDPGLTASLVADTSSGEALPLLAFTLRQLAVGLSAGGTLTFARYRELGGVRGALTRHADAALAAAVQTSGLTEHDVLAGLTRLVTVDDNGRHARRSIKLAGLPGQLRLALQVLIDLRLLLSDTDNAGDVWLAVVHEALLTEWRPLHAAIMQVAVALRAARTVEQAAAEWYSAGQSEHYLWDEERLAATVKILGITNDRGGLDIVTPPIVDVDNEAVAFLEATAQRVEATKARERRRRNRTSTVLAVLLVLALIAGSLAIWQQQMALSAQHAAIASGMTAQADRVRNADPRSALQLGVAATYVDGSPQSWAGLQQALTATPRFRTLRTHAGGVLAIAYAADGRTVAAAGDDGSVTWWDVGDRDHPQQPRRQALAGQTGSLDLAEFSPDARILATSGGDGTVTLWDVTDRNEGRPLGEPLSDHTGEVYAVAFALDGRTMAVGGEGRTVVLWDLTDRNRPRRLGQPLTGHTKAVSAVVFAPDGHTLAAASDDDTVILWDLTHRDRPRQLGTPLTGQNAAATAFAPDGRTLATTAASGNDGTVTLWDLSDRDRPRRLGRPLTGHTEAVYALAFTPDGRTMVTASADQTVRLWDLRDRNQARQVGPPLAGHTGGVYVAALARDGQTLATAGSDGTVIIWEMADLDRQVGPPLTGHTGEVWGVAFAPDGRTLAAAGAKGAVTMWDMTERDRPHQLGQPLTDTTARLWGLTIAPDGRTLATANGNGTVSLWDLTDRDQPHPLGQPLTGLADAVYAVAFARDGRTLAAAGADGTVILWDLTDRNQPHPLGQPLTGHTDAALAVAFAPDGRTLATGSADGIVMVWDLTDRERPHQLVQPLTGQKNVIFGLAFAPDGRTLAAARDDGTIVLSDLTDRDRPHQLGQPLTGHTGAVTAVAFAPDGRTLATAGVDGTARLWSMSDRNLPIPVGQPLTGHTDSVNTVAFAPDGRTLVTGGGDQTVRLWDLSHLEEIPKSPVREACIRAGGALDEATWNVYAPGVGYHDTCA